MLISLVWYLLERSIHNGYRYIPRCTIKIGIDIHGMIDYDPKFFATFSKILVESGNEVHIMTGSEIKPAIIAELRGYGIMC